MRMVLFISLLVKVGIEKGISKFHLSASTAALSAARLHGAGASSLLGGGMAQTQLNAHAPGSSLSLGLEGAGAVGAATTGHLSQHLLN